MIIKSAGITIPGNIRKKNEDNFYIDGHFKDDSCKDEYVLACSNNRDYHVYAVSDGMGGHDSGEKAAWYALEILKEFDDENIENRLTEYIMEVNRGICMSAASDSGRKRGATIAIVTVNNNRFCSCTVGDSRVYVFRNNNIFRISEDHTRAQSMINSGIISSKEAEQNKKLRILSQHLGIPESEFIICPDIKSGLMLNKGDIILLCSDGLTDMVDDNTVRMIIGKYRDKEPERIACELSRQALKNGGKDNITVIIIKAE